MTEIERVFLYNFTEAGTIPFKNFIFYQHRVGGETMMRGRQMFSKRIYIIEVSIY